MLRRALPLSFALALICGSGEALAARTTTAVTGAVRALAFSGDALVVAHRPPRRGIAIDRLVAGAPAQQLLETTLREDNDQIALAASPQALAIALQPDGGEQFGTSRVIAGPAAGPLREVSTCPAGVLAPPVAVAGARIAWRDGGCGEPTASPSRVGPAGIVIGAADPATPLRRVELGSGVLPVSIVLTGDGGLVGLLRPSFFAVDSEVRAFGPTGLGALLAAEEGRIVTPVGVLIDGTRVFVVSRVERGPAKTCPTALFTIAAGSTKRRELSLGGCVAGGDGASAGAGVRVAGDRIFAVVTEAAGRANPARPPTGSLVSVRGDGGERRIHAYGSHRPPLGFAADGERVAYWHPRCTTERSNVVVVEHAQQDAGPAAITSCTAEVLTRSAQLHDGRISVRLRCPAGCSGVAIEASDRFPRPLQAFTFEGGTHALALPVPKVARERGRVLLQLVLESGPARSAVVRLRR